MRWAQIAIAILLISGGCTETTQGWILDTKATLESVDGAYQIDGTVRLEGMSGNVTLTGVDVYFLDENRTVMATESIGRLGAGEASYRDDATFNQTFADRPEYIFTTVDAIEEPKTHEGGIVGLERDGSAYVSYSDYDPFATEFTPTDTGE